MQLRLSPSAALLLLLATIASSGCAPLAKDDDEQRYSYSDLHSDSAISGPSYQDIIKKMRELEMTFPRYAKVVPFGTSRAGQEMIAVRIMDYQLPTNGNRSAIIIDGEIHGDEYLGIADKLPEKFLATPSNGLQQYLATGGIVYVIPLLNPDGYSRHIRENMKNVDLNRDFALQALGMKGFTQPETKSLATFVQTELSQYNAKLKVSMDYHCCVGGLIYPWGYSEQKVPLPPLDLQRYRLVGNMVEGIFGYRHGTAMEIVEYPAPGASDDYYYETYKGLAFTFEGKQRSEGQKLEKHLQMWDQIFSKVASGELGGSTQDAPASNEIFVKISSPETAGSQLDFLAAAPLATEKLELCRGSKNECRDPVKARIRFTADGSLPQAKIFRSSQAVPSQVGDLLTFFALDGKGTVLTERTVQLKAVGWKN